MSTEVALVLGGADSLWQDYAAAAGMVARPHLVVATNNAGRDWPGRVDHWVTCHPEKLRQWLEDRVRRGHRLGARLWCPPSRSGAHVTGLTVSPVPGYRGGSSGLLAVHVARHVGAERVVLCGVPLTTTGRHYDDARPWQEAQVYRQQWTREADELRQWCRSMSGWTQDLLGSPTVAWLA